MCKKLLILFGVLLLFSSCEETSQFKVTIYTNKAGTYCEYLVDSAKMIGNTYVFKYKDRACNYYQENEETTGWVTPASGTSTTVQINPPLEQQIAKQTKDRRQVINGLIGASCILVLIFTLRAFKIIS